MSPHHHDGERPIVRKKGKEPAVAAWPTPSDLDLVPPKKSTRRRSLSQSTFAQPYTTQGVSQPSNNIPLPEGNRHNENHRSNTWTSSSENPDLLLEEDGTDDREQFVLEYNRLAQRHGIRPLVPGDFPYTAVHSNDTLECRRGSWFSKMVRQVSEQSEQAATKPDKPSLRHQRSLSDFALNFVHSHKRDGLKNQDLKTLVRLCGKSSFFLPTDYAPCSLTLPTCFRALAQSLVQHADTKGIFRVPGSVRVINALYDYYCTDSNTDAISSTTRCPTLPKHIRCSTHDMASTFKRFLAGLPGGILGCLSLFDALVAIHSQLQGDPELHWTKESKLRARLIAFAIGTVKSQYQRELICAVFGLLSLVGRVAENAPREDESGRPLPTADLMGYNALGIIFGPLLVGDLINNYNMRVADPSAGLVLLPVSPPRSKKERSRHKHKNKHKHAKDRSTSAASSFTVDKIHIANSITEMLIIHWREVVRQMRSIGPVKPMRNVPNLQYQENAPNDSSSVSEKFSLGGPPNWDHIHRRSVFPSTASPTTTQRTKSSSNMSKHDNALDQKTPQARQTRVSSSGPIQKQLTKAASHFLSPTVEESPSPHIKAPKLYYDQIEDINNLVSDLANNVQPITPDKRAGRVHNNSLPESVNISKAERGQPIMEMGTVVPRSLRLSGTRKDETPSPPLLQQYRSLNPISSDTSLLDQGRTRDPTTIRATLSPGSQIGPPVGPSPSATEAYPRHEHDTAVTNIKTSQHIIPSDDGAKTSQLEPNDVFVDNTRSSYPEMDREIVISKKGFSLEPQLLYGSRHGAPNYSQTVNSLSHPEPKSTISQHDLSIHTDDTLGHESLPRSTTNPNSWGRDHPTPTGRSLYEEQELSGIRDRSKLDGEISSTSPADQWRYIVASSKASTESLAKSAKERRLKRSIGYLSSRPSQEALIVAGSKPTTPEWKRQATRKRSEPKAKRTILSPERKSIFEESPQLASSVLKITSNRAKIPSPAGTAINPLLGGRSQRSTSKPVPGAVKAMAALFDNAIKESPNKPAAIPNGRTRNSLRESNNFLRHDTVDESPTKSSIRRDALPQANSSGRLDEHAHRSQPNEASTPNKDSPAVKNRSIVWTVPGRPPIEDTPTRSLRNTLQPVKTFTAARNELRVSPGKPIQETERNQPPRLGTIAPHQEEPPIGHFVRPSSATSPRNLHASTDGIPPLDRPNSRHASGNSFLHAQIRSLQRQLDIRNEEILQLRRQLETHENMDIGTLCEQLRVAKRECMSWRKRAEAAEKRIAVFQRFSSKFQALKDDEIDEARGIACEPILEDGSSSFSMHTEDREALNNRIKNCIMGKTRAGGGDGAVFEDDEKKVSDIGASRGYQPRRNRSCRTVQLWKAAQELLDLRDDNSPSL